MSEHIVQERHCPCDELKLLQEEVKNLKEYVENEINRKIDRMLIKDLVPERKRILKLEESLSEIKDNLSQLSALKSAGSWGISQGRAEIIYSRFLTSSNGNGGSHFFSTGDIKNILGVKNYSQAKAAMEECARLHLDTRIAKREKHRFGIERLENMPVTQSNLGAKTIGGRLKRW